jgi:hypothetical protein
MANRVQGPRSYPLISEDTLQIRMDQYNSHQAKQSQMPEAHL